MLFVADLHYVLKQFDWLVATAGRYDVVAIGGDLLDLGSDLELDVQIVVVEKYLARLAERTRLLVSSGNHDGDHRLASNESACHWIQDARGNKVFVDGDSLVIGDTVITICPWWDGDETRAEVERILARDAELGKSKWIWIHHSPPDQSPLSWAGRRFGGDEFLGGWITRYQPDIVLCGHIHNAPFTRGGSWFDRFGKTWAFNPGRQDGPCPSYLQLDLERMTIEWLSLDGLEKQRLDEPMAAA
jgi:Icc-related predicted phosphoesterase